MRACNKIVMIRQPVLLQDLGRLAVRGKERTGTTRDTRLNKIALQKGALVFIDQLGGQVVNVADSAVDAEGAIPCGVTKRCEPNEPCLPRGTLSLIAPWSLPAGLNVGTFVVWELNPVLGIEVVRS